MGQRASDTRGITFEDVVVPKEVSDVFYCTLYLPFHVLWLMGSGTTFYRSLNFGCFVCLFVCFLFVC